MLDQAEDDGFEVIGALVTHYHQDHVGGSIFGRLRLERGELEQCEPATLGLVAIDHLEELLLLHDATATSSS